MNLDQATALCITLIREIQSGQNREESLQRLFSLLTEGRISLAPTNILVDWFDRHDQYKRQHVIRNQPSNKITLIIDRDVNANKTSKTEFIVHKSYALHENELIRDFLILEFLENIKGRAQEDVESFLRQEILYPYVYVYYESLKLAFIVRRRALMESTTINDGLENGDFDVTNEGMQIYPITSYMMTEVPPEVFKHVVEFLEHDLDEPLNRIPNPLTTYDMAQIVQPWYFDFLQRINVYQVICAANYLHIDKLIMLGCAFIASLVKQNIDKNPTQILQILSLLNRSSEPMSAMSASARR